MTPILANNEALLANNEALREYAYLFPKMVKEIDLLIKQVDVNETALAAGFDEDDAQVVGFAGEDVRILTIKALYDSTDETHKQIVLNLMKMKAAWSGSRLDKLQKYIKRKRKAAYGKRKMDDKERETKKRRIDYKEIAVAAADVKEFNDSDLEQVLLQFQFGDGMYARNSNT
jgi:hypothetical protein